MKHLFRNVLGTGICVILKDGTPVNPRNEDPKSKAISIYTLLVTSHELNKTSSGPETEPSYEMEM